MIEINLENWSMEPLPLNPPLQKGETNHLPLGKGDREGFQEGRKRKRGIKAPLCYLTNINSETGQALDH